MRPAQDRGLRDPSTRELATVHASKGREWETVVLIGFEADRIPNRRSIAGALDPERALEEERRLAYVALTRATRQLILAFDPARPSPFLAEMGFRTATTRQMSLNATVGRNHTRDAVRPPLVHAQSRSPGRVGRSPGAPTVR